MNPLRIKVFTYFTPTISSPCETQINKWLAENPDIEIVQMLQSESMAAKQEQFERNMSISILYRKQTQ